MPGLCVSQGASAVLPGMGVSRGGPASPQSPALSLLSLNLSTGPRSLPIIAGIDLDNQNSQELIITRSFNQLMPIQLPLNLCWAVMLTGRGGVGMQKRIKGSIVPGNVGLAAAVGHTMGPGASGGESRA